MQTCLGVHHNTSVEREAPKGFRSEADEGGLGLLRSSGRDQGKGIRGPSGIRFSRRQWRDGMAVR